VKLRGLGLEIKWSNKSEEKRERFILKESREVGVEANIDN